MRWLTTGIRGSSGDVWDVCGQRRYSWGFIAGILCFAPECAWLEQGSVGVCRLLGSAFHSAPSLTPPVRGPLSRQEGVCEVFSAGYEEGAFLCSSNGVFVFFNV